MCLDWTLYFKAISKPVQSLRGGKPSGGHEKYLPEMPLGKKREREALQSGLGASFAVLYPSPTLQNGAGVNEFAFLEVSCADRKGCCLMWMHGCSHQYSGFVAVA